MYRYPGSNSFSIEYHNVFFGRSNDIESLSRRIQLNQTNVIFGKSGLGKSSLVQAGLIPQLEGSFLVINIRFGNYSDTFSETPFNHLYKRVVNYAPVEDPMSQIESDDISLWQTLKSIQKDQLNKKSNYEGVLLSIDQFEELFTYPEDEVQTFSEELSDLFSDKIPLDFRHSIEDILEYNPELISDSLLEFIEEPLNIKLLVSIRSDKIGLLDRISDQLPEILQNLYELKPLDLKGAEEAIVNPASAEGNFFSPPFQYAESFKEEIITYLSQGNTFPIESFQLQLLCKKIEEEVIDGKYPYGETGMPIVTGFQLSNFNNIIHDFYAEELHRLSPKEEVKARKLLEEGLVVEEDRQRTALDEGSIKTIYGVEKPLLEKLVKARMLRGEPNARGSISYELCHETLIDPILASKAKREEEERVLKEVEERKEKIKERRRFFSRIGVLAVLILSLLYGGSLTYLHQKLIASNQMFNKVDASLSTIKEHINDLGKKYGIGEHSVGGKLLHSDSTEYFKKLINNFEDQQEDQKVKLIIYQQLVSDLESEIQKEESTNPELLLIRIREAESEVEEYDKYKISRFDDNSKIDELMHQGDQLMADEKYAGAIIRYNRILNITPNNSEAYKKKQEAEALLLDNRINTLRVTNSSLEKSDINNELVENRLRDLMKQREKFGYIPKTDSEKAATTITSDGLTGNSNKGKIPKSNSPTGTIKDPIVISLEEKLAKIPEGISTLFSTALIDSAISKASSYEREINWTAARILYEDLLKINWKESEEVLTTSQLDSILNGFSRTVLRDYTWWNQPVGINYSDENWEPVLSNVGIRALDQLKPELAFRIFEYLDNKPKKSRSYKSDYIRAGFAFASSLAKKEKWEEAKKIPEDIFNRYQGFIHADALYTEFLEKGAGFYESQAKIFEKRHLLQNAIDYYYELLDYSLQKDNWLFDINRANKRLFHYYVSKLKYDSTRYAIERYVNTFKSHFPSSKIERWELLYLKSVTFSVNDLLIDREESLALSSVDSFYVFLENHIPNIKSSPWKDSIWSVTHGIWDVALANKQYNSAQLVIKKFWEATHDFSEEASPEEKSLYFQAALYDSLFTSSIKGNYTPYFKNLFWPKLELEASLFFEKVGNYKQAYETLKFLKGTNTYRADSLLGEELKSEYQRVGYKYALNLEKENLHKESFSVFNELKQSNPEKKILWGCFRTGQKLAKCYLDKREWKKAFDLFDHLLRYEPLLQEARLNPLNHLNTGLAYAKVLEENEKWKEAMSFYRQLYLTHPWENSIRSRYWEAGFEIADSLSQMGQWRETLNLYIKMLAEFPHKIIQDRYLNLGLNIGTSFEKESAWDSARDLYLGLMRGRVWTRKQIIPRFIHVSLMLADSLTKQTQWDKAMGIYEDLSELPMDSVRLIANMKYYEVGISKGLHFEKLKQWNTARNVYLELLIRDTTHNESFGRFVQTIEKDTTWLKEKKHEQFMHFRKFMREPQKKKIVHFILWKAADVLSGEDQIPKAICTLLIAELVI